MIERIFSKTQYYLIVLAIIVVYFLQDNKVLNFPNYVNVILFATAFIFVFIMVVRYDKRRRATIGECVEEIEEGEMNVFSGPVVNLLGIALISFTFLCLVKLPMLYYIEYHAKANALKSARVEIDNVKLRNNSVIYVKFRGEIEKLEGLRKSQQKLGKQVLIDSYTVQLEYRESILGTSVLERFRVVKKKKGQKYKSSADE